jgi:hypothetical protein
MRVFETTRCEQSKNDSRFCEHLSHARRVSETVVMSARERPIPSSMLSRPLIGAVVHEPSPEPVEDVAKWRRAGDMRLESNGRPRIHAGPNFASLARAFRRDAFEECGL